MAKIKDPRNGQTRIPNEFVLRNKVRILREGLNLKQSDLAREVGVTRQTILAIEKGRLNPSIMVCLKIARILREPVGSIFHLEDTSSGKAIYTGAE